MTPEQHNYYSYRNGIYYHYYYYYYQENESHLHNDNNNNNSINNNCETSQIIKVDEAFCIIPDHLCYDHLSDKALFLDFDPASEFRSLFLCSPPANDKSSSGNEACDWFCPAAIQMAMF